MPLAGRAMAHHIRRMPISSANTRHAPRPAHNGGQGDLFATALPAGFVYREDVIDMAEEAALAARFAELPFKPFEFHGYLGKRRVASFGWRYDYGERTLRRSAPIPDFLLPVRERAAAFAGLPAERLEQISVIEYAPGAGIGWHRDKPAFGDVVAMSLLAPCTLRFRLPKGQGWDRAKLAVAPRSAYLLRGPARRDWYHSIPPLQALRYSVTLRSLATAQR
jgi:alkylated DNA repair dioxygenase AlkB